VFHWGKLIGATIGFFVNGPIGLVFGVLLGAIVDKLLSSVETPRFTKVHPDDLAHLQKEFFIATFTTMGYVAYIGGQRNLNDIDVATRTMDRMGLPEDNRTEAIQLFNRGKSPEFRLENEILKLYGAYCNYPGLLEMFLEIQLFATFVKGSVTAAENQVLLNVCRLLEIPRAEFERLVGVVKAEHRFAERQKQKLKLKSNGKRLRVAGLEDAYALLNTTPNATDEEIKRAYRRLRSQHHPDKLIAKGLPEEMIKITEAKTREIRAAYERIKEVRGL
jgi:DnaJ like chaperone protein